MAEWTWPLRSEDDRCASTKWGEEEKERGAVVELEIACLRARTTANQVDLREEGGAWFYSGGRAATLTQLDFLDIYIVGLGAALIV